MAQTSLKIDGSADLNRVLRKLGADAERYVSDAINATGVELRGDIVKRYQKGPTTGTTYFRVPGEKYMTIRAGSQDGPPVAFIPRGGKQNLSMKHTASAPGESPATDTGRLASSVVFSRAGRLSAEVETKVAYGPMLEFGTQKIAMRPAWRPAVEAIQPKFQKRLEAALRKAMKT